MDVDESQVISVPRLIGDAGDRSSERGSGRPHRRFHVRNERTLYLDEAARELRTISPAEESCASPRSSGVYVCDVEDAGVRSDLDG
jgi:hypothetical protein